MLQEDDIFADVRHLPQRPSNTLDTEPNQGSSIHPAMLTLEHGHELHWIALRTQAPTTAQVLHQELRALLENAWLIHLCNPFTGEETGEEKSRTPSHIHLMAPEHADVPEEALRAFAFQQGTPTPELHKSVLAHLRSELPGDTPYEGPVQTWQASCTLPGGQEIIEQQLATAASAKQSKDNEAPTAWGVQPGALALKLLASLHANPSNQDLVLGTAGLKKMEPHLVQTQSGTFRSMGPHTFLALCDLVATAIAEQVAPAGGRVDWADCSPPTSDTPTTAGQADELENQPAPPPLIRITHPKQSPIHVPLGLELLRWCTMPLQPGEHPPTLTEWVKGSF